MASPEPTLPKPPPRPAPLLGPTTAASLLVGGTCLVGILNVWAAWHRHAVALDYLAGVPGIWVADLTSADATSRTVGVLYVIAMVAAGVALLVWLSRVRANARLLADRPVAAHPRRRDWAVGAWFTTTVLALVVTLLLREDATAGLATVATVAVVLQCAAGAPVIVVVRRITNRPAHDQQPA
ncbi:DUF4328 domain-containing protein [Actinophytocola sp.]|jgi:energy-converting hydrogenase Eha subunit A|uniref:DUF4328 domain-containing protein n=1 Tax=Actinophytocola sp. TaxID=1872138 RepID=UPI002ED995C8